RRSSTGRSTRVTRATCPSATTTRSSSMWARPSWLRCISPTGAACNPMATTCDVIVVGLGPGGEDVASKLAEAGRNVIGIEAELLGGECPYWGCIPSKMMVRSADLLAEGRRVRGRAGASSITPDWWPTARRISEATDNWDDGVAVERFEGKGGTFIRGRARLVSAKEVEVGGK